ncbi:type 1 glutamine amidotransferase [Geobacter hydrogenophilus]|uniref:GMP synthase n=1 Tax=Geobacter hydrogenophilus TaxID=40983 RepID=A0A9W6G1N7_9BACT|nr:type 1 glutamine amidotransferase [Geobacter hydrogenophilus]MBT0892803.1 type 1 glutamine amidotransferase [Geobacter hydrogenophilus]GLI38723.1 GMP synthase [Geobacter hydrogenophilus]
MFLIVQNDPEVPAGAYAHYLEEMGVSFRLLCPFAGEELPPAEEAAAVLVLGGAMGVHDTAKHPFLRAVKGFIAKTVAAGIPYLGICLGGQLLAHVLGAPVTTGANGEKGTLTVTLTPDGGSDPLFAGISSSFRTFQWHNDTFAIPDGGALLASSPACPHQAFRMGARAWGLQFHPEVTREIVAAWARWSDETAPLADRFVEEFAAAEPDFQDASRRILVNFIRIAGLV